MKKKIVILSLVIALLVSTPVFLYFYFSPKKSTPEVKYIAKLNETTVNYDVFIKEYTAKDGKQVIYLSNEDKDSQYIINSVLSPLSIQGADYLPEFVIVSLKDKKDITVTQLKDRFNVERTPSFIVYEIDENGKCKIISTLTHYDEEPITETSLKAWLVSQNLWNGPYDTE